MYFVGKNYHSESFTTLFYFYKTKKLNKFILLSQFLK